MVRSHSKPGSRLARRASLLAALILCGGVAASGAALAGPAALAAQPKGPSTFVVGNTGAVDGMNPYVGLTGVDFEVYGLVYDDLMDYGQTNYAPAPRLATSWSVSKNQLVWTYHIRHGVKWSDGVPLTAADVAYTFNLLNKFKGLDLNAIWANLGGPLTSVAQKGDQVVMTFKSAAASYFYYIADQIAIVPEHIWSKIADPVKYPDTNPVGTGAYTISPCTPENITYKANPHYYVPNEPHLKQVNYPAYTSNNTANIDLSNGSAQWGGQFIPSIQKFYLDKSPANHYWFPPLANVTLFINLKNPILKNLAVREAMAYAINRQRASTIGEYGYEPASNQSGVVTPTFSSWLDTSQAAAYGNNYAYNPGKALQILKAAGFKEVGGVMTKGSEKLSFSIINNGGFSDWVAAVNTLQADLKAVGIQVTPKDMAAPAYEAALYDGNYQLGYGSETGGPTPYYELRQWLYSGNTAPIGQAAGSNFERYSSPATDALINSYADVTSPAQQEAIVDKLQLVMLKDVPVIPVTESVDWYQYSTLNFKGWVTQSDPYAQPAPYNYPDWGQMLLKLAPK
jgi:peptide/nickel transport system substrate-binding protein